MLRWRALQLLSRSIQWSQPESWQGSLSQEEAEAAGVLYEQNLDRAKELLTEAGYADGFSLKLVSSEQTAYLTQYTVLQEELAQIGIKIDLEVVQHAVMHEQIRAGSNAITIYSRLSPDR